MSLVPFNNLEINEGQEDEDDELLISRLISRLISYADVSKSSILVLIIYGVIYLNKIAGPNYDF